MVKGVSLIEHDLCNIYLETEEIFEKRINEVYEIIQNIKTKHDMNSPVVISIDGTSTKEENVAERVLCLCRELIDEVDTSYIIDLGLICLLMRREGNEVVIDVISNRTSLDIIPLVSELLNNAYVMYQEKLKNESKVSMEDMFITGKDETIVEKPKLLPQVIFEIIQIVSQCYKEDLHGGYDGEEVEFNLKDGNKVKIKVKEGVITIFSFKRLICEEVIHERFKDDYNIMVYSLE